MWLSGLSHLVVPTLSRAPDLDLVRHAGSPITKNVATTWSDNIKERANLNALAEETNVRVIQMTQEFAFLGGAKSRCLCISGG